MRGYEIGDENRERCTPKVGRCIFPDGWSGSGAWLEPCDDWDGADFRLYLFNARQYAAVNVERTGRTERWMFGEWRVRCRITWVHEDEPNEVDGAWMRVPYNDADAADDEYRTINQIVPAHEAEWRAYWGYK